MLRRPIHCRYRRGRNHEFGLMRMPHAFLVATVTRGMLFPSALFCLVHGRCQSALPNVYFFHLATSVVSVRDP
jgi:hypothetical protein